VGIGGVGSWCAEGLARSGVGHISLIDSDAVCVTNINRQVEALLSTTGRNKVDVLRERIADINPRCRVSAHAAVFSRDTRDGFGIEPGDYVVDAIDSLSCKLDLIEFCAERGVKFFSSMGTSQKVDPTKLTVAGIWETRGCPLARLVRQGLRARGFTGTFPCVYSPERIPYRKEFAPSCGKGECFCSKREDCSGPDWCAAKKVINGSMVAVTAAAGMILASLVVRDVCGFAA
jgi:tRNA A37 threonylcarbamoyladenosine dehydratase